MEKSMEKNINTIFDDTILEQVLNRIDLKEYFYDDLDAVMFTYRIHRHKGLQVFRPEPSLLEVAGKLEQDQDQEILDFYGSLSKAVEDYAYNGSYEKWVSAFSEVTYLGFISLLVAFGRLPENYLSLIEKDVEDGSFTRVNDFIDRLKEDSLSFSHQKEQKQINK